MNLGKKYFACIGLRIMQGKAFPFAPTSGSPPRILHRVGEFSITDLCQLTPIYHFPRLSQHDSPLNICVRHQYSFRFSDPGTAGLEPPFSLWPSKNPVQHAVNTIFIEFSKKGITRPLQNIFVFYIFRIFKYFNHVFIPIRSPAIFPR